MAAELCRASAFSIKKMIRILTKLTIILWLCSGALSAEIYVGASGLVARRPCSLHAACDILKVVSSSSSPLLLPFEVASIENRKQ